MDIGHMQGRLTSRGRLSVPTLPGIATAGGGFDAAAAGGKRYGSGQIAPQRGMIANRLGYVKRDVAIQARRDALMQRAGYGSQPISGGM